MSINLQDLSKLKAGSDFAHYLMANGWEITRIVVDHTTDHLIFERGQHRIEYYNSYENLSTFAEVIQPATGGTPYKANYVNGPDLEGDLGKFVFLCHALGWVTFQEAGRNCQKQGWGTFGDLFKGRITIPS